MRIISVENISYQVGQTQILQNISFEIQSGDFVGMIGPNGAGKSTLAKIILGQLKPTKGKVTLSNNLKVSYVPQSHQLCGSAPISVQEILAMSDVFDQKIYHEALTDVDLDIGFLGENYHDLSGGQKQKVLIARALLLNPEFILFAEPLSAIDYKAKIRIYQLLSQINKKNKIAILFISHDVDHIVAECHKVLCLNQTLHTGCHPLDFAKGKTQSCEDQTCTSHVTTPVHHHHN